MTTRDIDEFEKIYMDALSRTPVVRSRDYYRKPTKKPSQTSSVAAPVVGSVEQRGGFFAVLESVIQSTTGVAAPQVKRAFLELYRDWLSSLNLEEIEELATTLSPEEDGQR